MLLCILTSPFNTHYACLHPNIPSAVGMMAHAHTHTPQVLYDGHPLLFYDMGLLERLYRCLRCLSGVKGVRASERRKKEGDSEM